MALGILEPRDGHHVPGTVTLDQAAANNMTDHQVGTGASDLKFASGKHSNLVLVPQPSNDPNDPLNWSKARKGVIFAIILMGTAFLCVIPAPMLNAGIVEVAGDLQRSFTEIAQLNGYMLLAIGAVSPFVSAIARKYGKRPVFVVSSIVGLAGCLTGQSAKSYNTLVAGRMLQGLGASAYESLCTAVVADLYFVHERGLYVALVIFFLSSLSNAVSILAGLITTNLGWRFNFYILLPFVALQTILVILFVPETTYNRSAVYNIDRVASDTALPCEGGDSLEKGPQNSHDEMGGQDTTVEDAATPKPLTFVQQLSLYRGTPFTEKSLLAMVAASFAIMANVIASYNILISGLIMAWFVAMSVLAGVMFAGPPWLFSAAAVGFVSAGPLIGGALATVLLVWASDSSMRWMTRRNNGVFEPEFRLPLAVIGGIFSVAGLTGFGHAIQDQRSIYAIATIWGVTLFGMSICSSITMMYAVDSHPAHSVEIFVMNITFKNFFFYGLTTFIVDWYLQKGPAQVFDVISGISAFLILLTIPMYIFGKRYRQHWSRHNVLVKLGLDGEVTAGHH
ncbi:hypothetical protein ACHAQA_005132 [Verticillium albo-atrum]